MNYVLSILILISGVVISTSEKFSFRGASKDFSTNNINIFFGGGLILCGLIITYFSIRSKNNTKKFIEYSKCPKCKEVYTYNELTSGKCKKCKDIDTIDLDEYYIKFPNDKYKECSIG